MRWDWILGNNRGIRFLPFWGPCEAVTISITSGRKLTTIRRNVNFFMHTPELLFLILDKPEPSDLESRSCNMKSKLAGLDVGQRLVENREGMKPDMLRWFEGRRHDAESIVEDTVAGMR